MCHAGAGAQLGIHDGDGAGEGDGVRQAEGGARSALVRPARDQHRGAHPRAPQRLPPAAKTPHLSVAALGWQGRGWACIVRRFAVLQWRQLAQATFRTTRPSRQCQHKHQWADDQLEVCPPSHTLPLGFRNSQLKVPIWCCCAIDLSSITVISS